MSRKIITLCVIILLVSTFSYTVFSKDFDQSKTGSISVTLTEQYDKTPIAGAELSLYCIATVDINSDGNLNYTYTDSFAETGIAIDDPELAAKTDVFISKNEIPGIKMTTDATGTVVWSKLSPGLYLICQTNAVDGFSPCTTFTVTLPFKNGDGYIYDVNASPKTEVTKLTSITIKKVWNTDASTQAAESIDVQLLHKDEVIRTATLNKENNWQITYTDMPQSDAYSVKEVNIPKGFTATYKQNGYVFTVTNTSSLIQTGQLLWPILIPAISGVILIWTGIVLLQKKRNSNA